MMSRKLLFASLLLALAPALKTRAGVAPAVISIDAAESPGAVNRLVFGHNMEAADSARIFSSDTADLNTLQTGGGFWDPEKRAPVPAVLERARQVGMASLRYPGGSLVHNYDWHKAVGPLESRGNWKFGLDEYLAFCQAVGAEPLITVSDYALPAAEMPASAADLVEYLNAPAKPGHPWALKRQEWGHPAPYGVKWFELGNESAEGNMRVLPPRKFTATEYAAYANATAAAMRAVDPTIKLGLVTMPGAGDDVECAWNQTVVRLAGKSVDYLIVHFYAPDVGNNTTAAGFEEACMAVGEQLAGHIDQYRALALRETGRALPVAVTEFNGPVSIDKPQRRFSYASALECADLLRLFLQPEHQVLTANYWQFLNGAFGMVRSDRFAPDGGKIEEKPMYFLYRLWAAHLGTRLAKVQVEETRNSFPGAGSVYPAAGDVYQPPHSLGPVPTDGRFDFGKLPPGLTGEGGTDGAFALNIDGVMVKLYPRLAVLPKPEGAGACDYDLNFDARFVAAPGSAAAPVALGLADARGWTATRSAIAIDGFGAEWKTFHAQYHALPDTAAIELVARLNLGNAKVSGRLEVRNFKIEAFSSPVFPAYEPLTAGSTLSEDGKTLHLIVFNKTADQDIPAQLHLAGFQAASARLWEVNGPTLGSEGGVAETVHGAPFDLQGAEPAHLFPAHSMTAIDFVGQAHPSKP